MAERGGDGVRYRSGREPAKLLNEIDMIVVLMVGMLVKRVAEKRGLTRRRVETQCRPAAIQRLMMDMCVTMRLILEKDSK